MIEVHFHHLAAQEFREAHRWYAERDVSVAERFKQAVGAAVERIQNDPESHPVLLDVFRWVRVNRFLYCLIFECPDLDRVLVIAIAHTSRRPQYWRGRD